MTDVETYPESDVVARSIDPRRWDADTGNDSDIVDWFSATDGWIALKTETLSASGQTNDFHANFPSVAADVTDLDGNVPEFLEALYASTATDDGAYLARNDPSGDMDMREGLATLNDTESVIGETVNAYRPGNSRADGISFDRGDQDHVMYKLSNMGGDPSRGTLSMWVKLAFWPTVSTRKHYLFFIPLADLSTYASDTYDNDNDDATNTDERDEGYQYLELVIENGNLEFHVSAAVKEGDMASYADADVDGKADTPLLMKDDYDNDQADTDTDGVFKDDTDELRIATTYDGTDRVPPKVSADITGWLQGEWHYVGIAWDLGTSRKMKIFVDGTEEEALGSTDLPAWQPVTAKTGWDYFILGTPPEDNSDGSKTGLFKTDEYPEPSQVIIDEVRLHTSGDEGIAEEPGGNRYVEDGGDLGTGGTFRSALFPYEDGEVAVPWSAAATRLVPFGTQLGTISWTEYLPTNANVQGKVEIIKASDGTTVLDTSSPVTDGIGSTIADGTGSALQTEDYYHSTEQGVRIRYVLDLVAGDKVTIDSTDYLLDTPIVDDVTITLLTPVRVLLQAELAE